MPKRILILTDSIAPPAYAPRIVSLCRYLTEQGHTCSVFSDCEKGVEPFSAPFGQWFATAYYHTPHTQLLYMADKLCGTRERQFQRFIERTVNVAEYDAIFCSTCYYFPLQTTYRLAQKYHKPFVVDLRDIAEQWGDTPFMTQQPLPSTALNNILHRLFTRSNLRLRNRVLQAADHIVTISPWHQQVLSQWNSRTHLIYNGYDTKEFYPKDKKTDTFLISYAGKIYNLLFRDPRLLFEALQQLLANHQLTRPDIELRFHVDHRSIEPLQQLADNYGMTDICHVSGYIPRTELLPLLHQSSILLVLTCKSTPEGAHGIMGTKFYEALGVEKPVLCIRSDEECLEQVVNITHAGLAGKDVQEVADFILDRYHEWQAKGFTRQPVNRDQKAIFTRDFQSRQLEQLLLSVTK